MVVHDARLLVTDGQLQLIDLLPVLEFDFDERLLVKLEVKAKFILEPLDMHHELMFLHGEYDLMAVNLFPHLPLVVVKADP